MTIKRWFFIPKDEGSGKESVHLYETEHSDSSSNASMIKLPKSKKDLGPVVNVQTTEGKGDKVVNKYGSVHGLFVSFQ